MAAVGLSLGLRLLAFRRQGTFSSGCRQCALEGWQGTGGEAHTGRRGAFPLGLEGDPQDVAGSRRELEQYEAENSWNGALATFKGDRLSYAFP